MVKVEELLFFIKLLKIIIDIILITSNTLDDNRMIKIITKIST